MSGKAREVKVVLLGDTGVSNVGEREREGNALRRRRLSDDDNSNDKFISHIQVGKSSLVLRFVTKHFRPFSESTIG
jgi:hypothetical protein